MVEILGSVELKIYRRGEIIHTDKGMNLVVAGGKEMAARNYHANFGSRISHAALGSGSTTPSEADTTLSAEIAGSRSAFSLAFFTSPNSVFYNFSFTAGVGWIMREAGLFSAAVGGTMHARFLTQEFHFQTGDVLQISWILQFGS